MGTRAGSGSATSARTSGRWSTSASRGGNYGWSVMEGSEPFRLQRTLGPGEVVAPVVAHPHSEARSVTGGIVYHGARLPELDGAYVYADHETGKIWGLRYDGQRVTWHEELDDISHKITSFATDADDELYMLALGGEIFVLDRATDDGSAATFPRRLSETGLFDSVADHAVAPGVIPYSVNAPLWSDGAVKQRYMAVPGDGQITFSAGGAWVFPEQTVLVKTFSLELEPGDPASRRRLETRLLTLQEKEWVGYTYLWNDEQTDAELVDRDGLDRTYTIRTADGTTRDQTWHFPGRTECMVCHSRAAGFVLGPHGPQMNREHDYDGVVDNQLRTLDHIGMFDKPLESPPETYARLVDPYDTANDVDARARSYLQGNCAHCHVMAGGGNSRMILSHATAPDEMFIFDVRPQHDRFGIDDAAIVASGRPDRSVLYHRVTTLGAGRMPPLASSVVDERAAAMLAEWIRSRQPAATTADNAP
ncbi:MAG: PQQ-dependent sugar dehydrogenase [Pirellulales bacterium]